MLVTVELPNGQLEKKSWSINEVIKTFDINYPVLLSRKCTIPGECALGSTPSINTIRQKNGIEVPEMIIKQWLTSIVAFMAREPFNSYQLNELTMLLINQDGSVRIAEFALFFNKFKACEYGQLYGDLRPTDILSAFQKYLSERRSSIDKVQRDRERRNRESQPVNVNEGNPIEEIKRSKGCKSIWEIYQSMKPKPKEAE